MVQHDGDCFALVNGEHCSCSEETKAARRRAFDDHAYGEPAKIYANIQALRQELNELPYGAKDWQIDDIKSRIDEQLGRLPPAVPRYPMPPPPGIIDAAHIAHQREFSLRTYGPGARTAGVIDHIRKELVEIEADPLDLEEWCDVIILAFDGAYRSGHEPQAIIDQIKAKQTKNEARTWPDWRTMPGDKAIEHIRKGN